MKIEVTLGPVSPTVPFAEVPMHRAFGTHHPYTGVEGGFLKLSSSTALGLVSHQLFSAQELTGQFYVYPEGTFIRITT